MPGSLMHLIDKIASPARLKTPLSYVFAAILVGIGVAVRFSLPGVLHSFPFLAFYPVLVFAAAFGGFGPGVLATVLSWLCVTYFFDPTPGIIGFSDPAELGRLAVFIIGGLGVSIVSEAQLRGKERQTEQARELKELNQLTDLGPFIVRNERDEIIHWSNGCVLLYGFTAEQALGRISYDLLRTAFPEPPEKIKETLQRTGRWQGELVHRRSDGTALTVSSQWVLQESSPGWVVLEISTDITRLKETEESLRRASVELKRSNEDLENFAYIASHDLQEPLRGINGFLTLLQQRYASQLDAKANEYIKYAVEGSARMSQLIHDLLRYSRTGRKEQSLQPTDTRQVLREALANLQSSVEEAGAEVTSEDLPVVLGDPVLLTQVLQNLIGNAIKFRSPEKKCEIHVGCSRTGAYWEFSVRDNGIGIQPEHFDRIFVVFRRLHTRRKYPGTGIGLAICKKIVERHGGRIWVESKLGEGSTFHFLLYPAPSVH